MALPTWAPVLAEARATARATGQPVAPLLREALAAWLRAAVGEALAAVGEAEGGRNPALNAAAYDLGRLVGAGVLAEDEASASLEAAGVAAGLPLREVRSTIRSGLKAGKGKPAKLPDIDAPPPGPLAPSRPAPQRKPEPPPARLPRAEVEALWGAAWPAFTESRALRWFNARGLDDGRAGVLDLARALPPGAPCPRWARCNGKPWAQSWPLLLPCFDAAGDLVALRARRTATRVGKGFGLVEAPPAEGEGAKEVSPGGSGACRGTVYADPVGRWLLSRGPAARPGDLWREDPPTTWSGSVLVVEGGPAWLRFASEAPDPDPTTPGRWTARAVLGLWAGAWPDDDNGRALAARIPDGARVLLAPDDDDPGNRYADLVIETLRGRAVELRRLPRTLAPGGDDGPRT